MGVGFHYEDEQGVVVTDTLRPSCGGRISLYEDEQGVVVMDTLSLSCGGRILL